MKISTRFLSILLTASLVFFTQGLDTHAENGVNARNSTKLSNPRIENGSITWDCIYFGNYKQVYIEADEIIAAPIKWRVLQIDGNKAFVLADKNINLYPYNTRTDYLTWEDSSIRQWLNSTFWEEAFSQEEKNVVYTTKISNPDNPMYGTTGGNVTEDKLFLLSAEEVMTPEFGFLNTYGASKERTVKNTDYAILGGETGAEWIGEEGRWWLRTPGVSARNAALVYEEGNIQIAGHNLTDDRVGVRPAMYIDLSNTSLWRYAGKASANGEVYSQYNLSGPSIDNGIVSWDCIYFGNYPQSDISGNKKEPIKWRVLEINEDEVFLLSDKNIDVQRYHNKSEAVTWETCTMRTWLNNNFIKRAFSQKEENAIMETYVKNSNRPEWSAQGGNDTKDKVFLLSFQEAWNYEYRLHASRETAINTAYTAAGGTIGSKGMKSAGSSDAWWLRTPGENNQKACFVSIRGQICFDYGFPVNDDTLAVRPALRLNLSDESLWSHAGKVSELDCSERDNTPNDTSGKNEENNDSSQENTEEEAVQKKTTLKKGTKIVDKTSKAAYIVTSDSGKTPTVTWKESINKQSGSIKIPSTIKKNGVSYKVTAIGKNALKNNKYITDIRIPSSIVKIDTGAFEGCTSLKTVTIGTGLKSIGKTAFKNCKKLKTLTIKSTKLKTVGKNAFKGIYAKCKIKVPAKKVKAYTKLMKKKGQAVTVKVTK